MDEQVRLFDSHAGATLDGLWLGSRPGLSFAALREAMTQADFVGGLIQGLVGVGGYELEAFAAAALAYENFWPVAAWSGAAEETTVDHIARLRRLGFIGVHVHPRAAGKGPDSSEFATLLSVAAAAELPVFYCTYQFADVEAGLPVDPLPALAAALRQAPTARLVLLHGGTVELLRYAEFVRANPRVLLDLSFTLMRYAGSSLDADLRYVFRTLDRRVGLGTDAPAGSGVQPLGILRMVSLLSALGDVPAEIAFCFATGNTARMRALDCGIIEVGRAADFVVMDKAQHSAGKNILDTGRLGLHSVFR